MEKEKVYNLLFAGETNLALAIQLLEGSTELAEAIYLELFAFVELISKDESNHYAAILLEQLETQTDFFSLLPKLVEGLTELEYLYLDNKKLKDVAEQVGTLSQLKILRLDKNRLKKIPKSIGNL